MYTTILTLHSLLRWAVLLVGIAAIALAFGGWLGRKPWSKKDNAVGAAFTGFMDLQLLLGIALYGGLSPVTQAAFSNFGAAMKDKALRFWAVEHIAGMLIAVVLVHIGRAKSKRASDPVKGHKLAAIFFTIGLLLVLASIPWPGTAVGRPLFRWFE